MRICLFAPHMNEKTFINPTCDCNGDVALLSKYWVDQSAAVGTVGLQHHC